MYLIRIVLTYSLTIDELHTTNYHERNIIQTGVNEIKCVYF